MVPKGTYGANSEQGQRPGMPAADWLPGSADVTGPGRLRSRRQGLPPDLTGTYASARPTAGGATLQAGGKDGNERLSGDPGLR
jgi:hypothetical protein